MLEIIPIDPFADERWMSFLLEHDGATIFHHPLWLKVLQETYGHRQCSFGVLCDGRLIGILPMLEIHSWLTGRRGVCLPFSDSCGPLLGDPAAADLLMAHCSTLVRERRWRYLEIRRPLTHPSLVSATSYKSHAVPLSGDCQTVLHHFKRSHVQHFSRAERDGVVIERASDESALKEFIRLNALTRKKHGVPPQPDRFFLQLLRHLLSAGFGFISVARLNGRAIAASVFLHFKTTLHYKYGASDESALEHGPNHLIMWEAIQWACARGFRTLDLGRSDSDNEGLIRYKRAWGAVESDLGYMRVYGAEGQRSGTTAAALSRMKPLLRRLPVGVLKLIGKTLYGHAE